MKTLRFDAFGRDLLIIGSEEGWSAFYLGNEGKRRPAHDIIIPPSVKETEMARYLDDLLHEWATHRNNSVKPRD